MVKVSKRKFYEFLGSYQCEDKSKLERAPFLGWVVYHDFSLGTGHDAIVAVERHGPMQKTTYKIKKAP